MVYKTLQKFLSSLANTPSEGANEPAPESLEPSPQLESPTTKKVENVKIWDTNFALDRARNNSNQLKKLIGIFLKTGQERVTLIRSAIDCENYQDAFHEAHTVKGVAANLGADKLKNISAKIELKCRQENFDDLESDAIELSKVYNETEALLLQYLGNSDTLSS